MDKLVRVRLLSRADLWVLIHIEVQSQPDKTFPARMFVYYYRLRDRHGVSVASFAVLADPDAAWRPEGHAEGLWGTRCEFRFEWVKLLDYAGELERLRGERNPFAAMVEVHLRALATRRVRPERRLREKLELVRSLYRRGFTREELEELLQFLDWLLVLPENLEEQFDAVVTELEEERAMPVISPMEKRFTERGRRLGREEGLQQAQARECARLVRTTLEVLERRLGPVPPRIAATLQELEDAEALWSLLAGAAVAETLAVFEAGLASACTRSTA